ncbi:MAG: HD domain-containing protein [Rhodocyclales bacterium]|nr:HD domain-containing protein [Rhodocyclales bacterium]
MSNLVPVQASEIALGRPLRHSVYDRNGQLLLRAGATIAIPHYLDALLANGLFFDQAEVDGERCAAEAPSAFAQAEKLLRSLQQVYVQFAEDADRGDLPERIRQIAGQLMRACGEDGDAVLAALHLDRLTPYRVHHQMLAATIIELTTRTMALAEGERLPLVCAALTHDIALVGSDPVLEGLRTPLTEEQRAVIRAHPRCGVEVLSSRGVVDAIWLDAVAQHHECMDGSGYPQGLRGDAIGRGGRLLAIADVYSAMIRSRPYRGNAFFPQNVWRDIFLNRHKYVSELTQLVVRSIGMMPPGSLVRLANNEMAVVRSRGSGALGARVVSVCSLAGVPLPAPVERDVTNPAYAVVGKANNDQFRSVELIMRRLWLAG